MAQLSALGARSVPVVSRGDRYVFAQVIKDVVDFLGLSDDTAPELAPTVLAERYLRVLETAVRLVRQMPDNALGNELPNRPRSWLVLMHHIFQIPASFLDTEDTGEMLTYENMVAPPPPAMRSSEAVAQFGAATHARFANWWNAARNSDFDTTVEAYFGETSRHELFERTVWHATQHVRQLASLLEQAGVTPDRPLTSADISGLPLTEKIWDEA